MYKMPNRPSRLPLQHPLILLDLCAFDIFASLPHICVTTASVAVCLERPACTTCSFSTPACTAEADILTHGSTQTLCAASPRGPWQPSGYASPSHGLRGTPGHAPPRTTPRHAAQPKSTSARPSSRHDAATPHKQHPNQAPTPSAIRITGPPRTATTAAAPSWTAAAAATASTWTAATRTPGTATWTSTRWAT